jgi:hypothetical protein
MTVKELINKLLDAPMDAEALISVNSNTDTGIFCVAVDLKPHLRKGAYVAIVTNGEFAEIAEESP